MDNSNSRRFINAYNSIDKTLRNIYGYKPTSSFTEVVRRSAQMSRIVAKYEDELIAYSRLRNAIVHESFDGKVIAEPHIEVVEELETVARLLQKPPPVLSAAHKAVTLDGGIKLNKAIMLMTKGGFSNVPVIKDGRILGVATNKLIVEGIAKALNAERSLADYLTNSVISDVLTGSVSHFEIVAKTISIDEALTRFHVNKKLRMIVITDKGKPDDDILGVVTVEDFSAMSDILFNY